MVCDRAASLSASARCEMLGQPGGGAGMLFFIIATNRFVSTLVLDGTLPNVIRRGQLVYFLVDDENDDSSESGCRRLGSKFMSSIKESELFIVSI